MKILFKKAFQEVNFISSLRKILAYLIIFSLLWQNSLWAIRILEEDLEGARARIYAHGKVGIVEPGAVRNKAVHNVFEDLQLLEGGIVFKGNSQAETIYNRIYSKSPIPLSGVIEADRIVPMVFANSGGIALENPDFKRIHDLTLIAGGIAQTNEGIAYGIGEGILSIKQTFFEDATDVKFLTLAGREIHVGQSLLSPSETISLMAGQHIKGLEQQKWMNVPTQGSSQPHQSAIYLDGSTILRSKGISLTSLEEGAAIHSKGLLQATDEDIIIRARGDIYLDKLVAHRNLNIETTGKVFFGNQTFVGGNVRVKAENITIDKELSSVGRLYLKASKHLSVNGTLGSKENMNLVGQGAIDFRGNITSHGAFIAVSKGTISQEGSLFARDSVRMKGQSFIKNGSLVAQSFIKILTEGDIDNQEGEITSSHWSKFSSKVGKIINTGRILAGGAITAEAKETQNSGFIHTRDILKTNKDFFNQKYGTIEAKSLSLPLAVLTRNVGTIGLQDDLKLKATAAVLRGNIATQGRIDIGGQDLTVEGQISTKQGFSFDNLKTLTNKGTISAFGAGFQGKIATLHNEGKIDCSSANTWIRKTTNQKTGIIRTRGHFILQGDHSHNEGKVFTCGVHQVTLTGSYEDTGTFYSPTLFLLNARDIRYHPSHKSYFKDAVVRASSKLTAGERVSFVLEGNQNPCFLQMSSQGDLSYSGEIRQLASNRFPLLDYFSLFGQTPVSYQDFGKEVSSLPLGPWREMKRSLGSGVTLQAGRNLNCQKAIIDPESVSVNLIANGQFYTDGAKLKAGYFKGNNAAIQSRTAILNDTKLSSLFGTASLFAHESAEVKDSYILGGQHAEVRAQSPTLNTSTVRSSHGTALVQGSDAATLIHSTVKGHSLAGVRGKDVYADSSHIQSKDHIAYVEAEYSATVHQSRLKGKKTVLEGGKYLTLSSSSLESGYNKLMGAHISTTSDTFKGTTVFDGKEDLKIHDLQAEGVVLATAPRIDFSGRTKATSLGAEGTHLKNTGTLTTEESLRLKGETIEQLGTTKAGESSHIEATKTYLDTASSRNEAGGTLSLIAEETTGFKGYQKGGKALVVKLQDMNLLDLLNQTEAPVTEAHLKEGDIHFDEDFTLNRTLHLWAKRLENKAKFTATQDFIAHIQTTIMNQGSIDIHGQGFLEGKEGITTRNVKARKGLGLKTDARFTLRGTADGGEGALSIDAGKIDADAEGTSVNTFKGTGVYLTSHSSILARGGRIFSQGDAQILAGGDVDFDAVAYNAGDRTRYLSSLYQVKGNLGIQTKGRYIGRALQASTGGNFFLKANQGVNLDGLASVYEAERWSYRTGWFDQNRHYGFREEAEFFRTQISSQGKIYIWSPEGDISARAASFFGADSITLDADGKVNLGALKPTVRYYSYDESGVWRGFLGSIDEQSVSTERVQTLQARSNKKIGVFSRQSTIEAEAPHFCAPEVELYGDRGVFLRPVIIHSEGETHHRHFRLTLNPLSPGVEYGQQDTKVKQSQEYAGKIEADHLMVGTGEGAEASFVANISGMRPGGKTDITADTDKITFAGTKKETEKKTDSLTVGIKVDLLTGMPGGKFDISHDEGATTTHTVTVQNFGVFHNKRKGAKLVVQQSAQTTIEETRGEDMEALVDHNAQDTQSQLGYGFGVEHSSTSAGAHGSIKGGGKTDSDQLTRLEVKKSTNNMTRTDISHEDRVKDNRWGVGAGFSISEQGVSASLQGQYQDRNFSIALPLDKNPLETLSDLQSFQMPTDLNSANKLVGQLSSINTALNNCGIDTRAVGDVISMAQQGTQLASQATTLVDQVGSLGTSGFPTNLEAANKMLGQLSSINTNLNNLGVNTGGTGDVLNAAQQGTQIVSQTTTLVDQARSLGTSGFSTNFNSVNQMLGQLRSFNTNLNNFGFNTGGVADTINIAEQEMQLISQAPTLVNRVTSLSTPEFPMDLNSVNQILGQASSLNNTLNNWGVTTGGTGDVLNAAQQGTQIVSQATHFVNRARSFSASGDLDSVNEVREQLSAYNATLNNFDINTKGW